jgi:hypothetical protein
VVALAGSEWHPHGWTEYFTTVSVLSPFVGLSGVLLSAGGGVACRDGETCC